jgi:predicted metal-dependent HD superfamily phosphohydrolase
MKRTHISHWRDCCEKLGWLDASVAVWYDRLTAAYSEPQRYYHTLQHLEECLSLMDLMKSGHLAKEVAVIEMALWFHDAIYDPKLGDNEERSANLALEALEQASVAAPVVARIQHLILLTKEHRPVVDVSADEAVLLDIDLAIFGKEAARFDEYERQIRSEYGWVTDGVYRVKRVEILGGFLQRNSIYLTSYMRSRFEQAARQNIQRLIAQLL